MVFDAPKLWRKYVCCVKLSVFARALVRQDNGESLQCVHFAEIVECLTTDLECQCDQGFLHRCKKEEIFWERPTPWYGFLVVRLWTRKSLQRWLEHL